MKMKIDNAKIAIEIAMNCIDGELMKSSEIQTGIPSDHLKMFKMYLKEMLTEIMNNEIPVKSKRIKKMSHIILDSWPIDSSVGDKIMLAESLYMDL